MQLISHLTTATAFVTPFLALPSANVAYVASGVQVFLSAANFLDDPNSSAPYSKFSHEKAATVPVSGRTAMLLIYVPSAMFLSYYLLPFLQAYSAGELTGTILSMSNVTGDLVSNGRESLVAGMLFVHFFKRILETLFLHKYSSKQTDGIMGGFIGFYYAVTCWLITNVATTVPASILNENALYVGLGSFAVGELGNLYHHYLLRTLRKDTKSSIEKKEKGETVAMTSNYSVPTGGLFEYVTMPHYLFELIAWLGIASVSQHFNVYMVFISMFAYLLTRSKATKIWYLKNVDGYPSERKFLIPFVL